LQEESAKNLNKSDLADGRAERFFQALKKLGFKNISQLARQSKLSRSTAYYLAKGGKPSEATSKILYNIGFNTIWLETGEGPVTLVNTAGNAEANPYRVRDQGIVLKVSEEMVAYERKDSQQITMEIGPRDFFPLILETLPQLTDNELKALRAMVDVMLKGRTGK
jgi:DNA-binding phage protein